MKFVTVLLLSIFLFAGCTSDIPDSTDESTTGESSGEGEASPDSGSSGEQNQPPEGTPELETGSFLLTFHFSKSFRPQTMLITPYGEENWLSLIEVHGSGPENLSFDRTVSSGGSLELTLAAGEWRFSAAGRDKNGTTVATGSGEIRISAGYSSSMVLPLYLITGEGSVRVRIESTAGLLSPAALRGVSPRKMVRR